MARRFEGADLPAAKDAVKAFATVLSEARKAAGSPSFRAMAGRSGCISHTSLYDAAKGHRFPSWSTTAEFARAIGRDPADFRDEWERVERLVHPRPAAHGSTTAPPAEKSVADLARECSADDESVGDLSGSVRDRDVAPHGSAAVRPPKTDRRDACTRWILPAALAAAILAIVVGVGVAVNRGHLFAEPAPTPKRTAPVSTPPPYPGAPARTKIDNPSVCPTKTGKNNMPPLNEGDHAEFIPNASYPSCATHIAKGEIITKVFTLKNTGEVPWKGRSITRADLPLDDRDCMSEVSTRIPDTNPGQTVEVPVEVTAPQHDTLCVAQWMMEDHGKWAFPGQITYKLQVYVH